MMLPEAAGVRYWHKPDIRQQPINVRYRGKSGHADCAGKCPYDPADIS
jgi:hypothetical protein